MGQLLPLWAISRQRAYKRTLRSPFPILTPLTLLNMTFKIAFVYYSLYGHIQKLIDTAAEGVKEKYGKDAEVTIFRVYAIRNSLARMVLTIN
jgi:hypothetical protein